MTVFTRLPGDSPDDQLTVARVDAPWSDTVESRTLEHQLLESSTTLFTFRPPRAPNGTMHLRFTDSATAYAARAFFTAAAHFRVTDPGPVVLPAVFAVSPGTLSVTQEVGSWVLALPWREVIE
ncbi:hypothetical protein IC744_16090 [Microbacterium hominis]|uniref:hypothetical protein n=1 Tax=Microbacterium hominis TaxID=162426 RepID=UPI00168ACAD8|nr:hypothetical protein [Microbacterium hominis]QOC24782.1 hypothetical protein IC745_10330 [Microbacterium hominis]QOC28837.1 hypothetical protein IC744_16090 [Microbacterium hominis]